MNRDDMKKLAQSAMLHYDDQELDKYTKKFVETMEIIDSLKTYGISDEELSKVEPTFQPIPLENHLAEDEIKPSLTQEEALANTEAKKYGFFEVTRFVD